MYVPADALARVGIVGPHMSHTSWTLAGASRSLAGTAFVISLALAGLDVSVFADDGKAFRSAVHSAGTSQLRFEAVDGRAGGQAKFFARGPGYAVWLKERDILFAIGHETAAATVRLQFEGSRAHPELEPVERLSGVTNYLLGRDPRRWRTGVPLFSKVSYRNLYPGIDA